MIKLISVKFILDTNRKVCEFYGNKHICSQIGKLESALHSAFFPSSPPYQHGGASGISAAIFFYLIKNHAFFDGNKRTALICATSFIEKNGYFLKYPISKDRNDFAQLAEDCAANKIGLDEIKTWFQSHKYQKN